MAEFDYKQRPFKKQLTDEEYDRAVGRALPKRRHIPLDIDPYQDGSVPDATGDSIAE